MKTIRRDTIWRCGQIYMIMLSVILAVVLIALLFSDSIIDANKVVGYCFIGVMVPNLIFIAIAGFLSLNYVVIEEDAITFHHAFINKRSKYKFSDIEHCDPFYTLKGPKFIIIQTKSSGRKSQALEMITSKQFEETISILRSKLSANEN